MVSYTLYKFKVVVKTKTAQYPLIQEVKSGTLSNARKELLKVMKKRGLNIVSYELVSKKKI